MAIRHLVLIILAALSVKADVHDDFPQWDRIHWLVPSTETITLKCKHPSYYPFNDIATNGKKVMWILPKETSYRHLANQTSEEGFMVGGSDQEFSLIIKKNEMNVPEASNGMYVCAALAKVDPNNTTSKIYSWYYLRWGVGLYMNVPAMNSGSIGEKYYWCFTYAWVSCLVAIVIIILFAVTVHFRYKGGPVEESDNESVGLDGLSIDGRKEKRRPSVTSSSSIKRGKSYEDTYSKF
ncbi:unnamed protein product [Rodentolepis nana]|uniref:Ig-like domain-containing protein n=1 Tax=Rodentolepis nana TaxID=102285 RepID=A0A0R3THH5_RODNA|nr:unnamed protein product [Rodentolepis nana]